jgi:hypothetical protein
MGVYKGWIWGATGRAGHGVSWAGERMAAHVESSAIKAAERPSDGVTERAEGRASFRPIDRMRVYRSYAYIDMEGLRWRAPDGRAAVAMASASACDRNKRVCDRVPPYIRGGGAGGGVVELGTREELEAVADTTAASILNKRVCARVRPSSKGAEWAPFGLAPRAAEVSRGGRWHNGVKLAGKARRRGGPSSCRQKGLSGMLEPRGSKMRIWSSVGLASPTGSDKGICNWRRTEDPRDICSFP